MTSWLFGIVLGFYLLAFGLSRLPLNKQKPQLLRWIHLGGWGLVSLQLLGFSLTGISLRGQWADMLPFAANWLTAGSYFLLRRRQLNWAGKLYFGSWFVYPAALAGAYLLKHRLFNLVATPVVALLPHYYTEYADNQCTIRLNESGPGRARTELITPFGPLERYRGHVPGVFKPIRAARVLAERPDTIYVLMTTIDWHGKQVFVR